MSTKPDPSRLGRAISTFRDITGLTQDEISRRGGPSDVTIRGLERGAGKLPNAATLRKIDLGLGWPDGFAAKVLVGDADVFRDVDDDDEYAPSLLDYTQVPEAPPLSERDVEAGFDAWQGERPLYSLSTSELLTEITGRFRMQEARIRELEAELAAVRPHDDRSPAPASDRRRSDGATTHPDPWTLAAMAGHSEMERLDAEADARGEESQDPGGEEPA